MSTLEILNEFKEIFPGKYPFVRLCEKVGSKTIKIWLTDCDKPLLFMFKGKDDWSFGTKIWRMKPGSNKSISKKGNK